MTARRFFECRCGHKLRFGSAHCGDCHDVTPAWNRRWFWALCLAGLAVVVIGVGMMALASAMAPPH